MSYLKRTILIINMYGKFNITLFFALKEQPQIENMKINLVSNNKLKKQEDKTISECSEYIEKALKKLLHLKVVQILLIRLRILLKEVRCVWEC